MQLWLFITVNVCVAAFVGALTNHFAIKMLFHPRRALYILGRRVPFTPGLIPKRKDEIAAALGHVVADYLVTADGIREWLRGGAMQEAAAAKIRSWLLARAEEGLTAERLILKFTDRESWEAMRMKWAARGNVLTERWVERLWEEGGWKSKRLAELVPGWSEEKAAGWAEDLSDWLTASLREELLSIRGQRTLRNMIDGLLDRTGGWIGVLAGIFVDEDKAAAKLTEVLVEQLESGALREMMRTFIAKKLAEAGDWTLEQAAARLSGEENPLPWLKEQALRLLRLEERIGELEKANVGELLIRHESVWGEALRTIVGAAFDLLDRRLETVVAAFELPQLVQKQVEKFPVEQVERIILSLSGREFRAITWLGALLGGIIGLIQSVFLQLVR
ncbi:uncharacterized UPF0754 membrane protein BLi01057/BL02871, yheB [Thermobacillus xylanilyticus]|uniref:Uncharacterized UPF0754 membrane protein BLi01057/BL02871, yheB n=1 Tax=Thermobacillus xylanilyticus TaxID=76633 RepID=A0ABM8V8V3_THEXY|nr:DUF445 domain-containing protein [Thermobacillus xylanilyticus]CAG5091924.1 uncharacterized UPF0754 membrane protein BLi01057/BL02871, yheB [Thermobacillus xylanilyticus]